MLDILTLDVERIPGFYKVVSTLDLPTTIFHPISYGLDYKGKVILEETGENVIPYFDMGLYINLDTLNIIAVGRKNYYNIVGIPLKPLMEKEGIFCSRETILLALERFAFGYDINSAFELDCSNGSMISRTVGSVMNKELVDFFYYDVKEWILKTPMELIMVDRGIRDSRNRFIVRILKILRTIGKDYVLRSCVELPEYSGRVLDTVVGKEYSTRVAGKVEKELELEVFDLEGDNKEREFYEDFIDLYRLSCKIKIVKGGS